MAANRQMTDNTGSKLELLKTTGNSNYRSTFSISEGASPAGSGSPCGDEDKEVREGYRLLATIFGLFLLWVVVYSALFANDVI